MGVFFEDCDDVLKGSTENEALHACSFITSRLTDREDGPLNDWSWVILNLGTRSPYLIVFSCCWQLRRAREALGMICNMSSGSGRAKPHLMSSVMILSSTWAFFTEDLWFPRSLWRSRSMDRRSSEMSSSGKLAP